METILYFFHKRTRRGFKSYYVVWKLRFYDPETEKIIMFKSYYVVWKLDPPNVEKKEEYSLNRTM